jgi:hypothetical protein
MSNTKQVGVISAGNYQSLFGDQLVVLESQSKKISGENKKPRYFLKGDGFVIHVNSQAVINMIFGKKKSEILENKTPEKSEPQKPEIAVNTAPENSEKTLKKSGNWLDDL